MVNGLVANNGGDAGIHASGGLAMLFVTLADNDSDIIFNP
jgi:hypothetical protein